MTSAHLAAQRQAKLMIDRYGKFMAEEFPPQFPQFMKLNQGEEGPITTTLFNLEGDNLDKDCSITGMASIIEFKPEERFLIDMRELIDQVFEARGLAKEVVPIFRTRPTIETCQHPSGLMHWSIWCDMAWGSKELAERYSRKTSNILIKGVKV
jgi:hypothetical protein